MSVICLLYRILVQNMNSNHVHIQVRHSVTIADLSYTVSITKGLNVQVTLKTEYRNMYTHTPTHTRTHTQHTHNTENI